MTEAEWLGAIDPATVVNFWKGTASERKIRLFAVGCCRRIWYRLARGTGRVESDGPIWHPFESASWAERSTQQIAADVEELHDDDDRRPFTGAPLHLSGDAIASCDAAITVARYAAVIGDETPQQLTSLRCIFGNPFRPVVFERSWLTSTTLGLAEGIYADRAFDRLPILADALQDAGCESADVLTHLRGDGPHVRGCWALDLVLGKE